jgi:quinol-cytochrome oxidoreductase complex cytochrome b subunit
MMREYHVQFCEKGIRFLKKACNPYSPPTLNRFYSIHFVLPFLIAGVSLIHLALLHKVGSNNPIGSDTGVDDVPFYPYFFSKDLFALSCFLFFFSIFIFYFPNVLNHPDNCIPADPLQTPAPRCSGVVFSSFLCNFKIYSTVRICTVS